MQRIQNSPQYRDNKFRMGIPMNPGMMSWNGFINVATEWLNNDAQTEPDGDLSIVHLKTEDFGTPITNGIHTWWMGHSSVVMDVDGLRILTDPVWSKRASMFQWLGPKRYFDPLIALENLPQLDAVVISHDHYDHLDEDTIKKLAKLELQKDMVFVVPLGVGNHLRSWGIHEERIIELDWWEETKIKKVTLACTPARHMSGRGLLDQNKTLWASWSIIGPKHRVYFGGDSGLTEKFEQIGDRYGPFDLTMLDTGQYGKYWPDVHMGPEQAVIAQKALRGKLLLPIHWGMFTLSTHSWIEPAERMRAAAAGEIEIVQPKPGQAILLTSPLHDPEDFAEPWWNRAVKWLRAKSNPINSTHLDQDWITRMQARPRLEP